MNVMDVNPVYEAPFPGISAAFRGGEIVYTEDVGGSSPSSPTIKALEILGFACGFMVYLRSSRLSRRTSKGFLMPRKRPSTPGYIYFLRAGNEVKIGFSTDLRQRLEKLRNGNAFPVFICRYVEGSQAKEREFHRRFAEYRLRGEWFDLRGSLARYLERHIHPVDLPAKVHRAIRAAPVMDKGIGYM